MPSNLSSDMLNHLRRTSKLTETSMDPLLRKQTGSYYTDLELTENMMAELTAAIRQTENTKELWEQSFLEPCVGTGNFVFSYINNVARQDITIEQARELLENIYVSDINQNALSQYKKSLKIIADYKWGINLSENYFKNHIGKGLLFDISLKKQQYIQLSEVFPRTVIKNGFDIVATNPPYKNLKAEKKHYNKTEEYEKDQELYSEITAIARKRFHYTSSGILNLYKLFVEEIIDEYSNKDAFISLLIPASILTDKTCSKLRSHILLDNKLISVKCIKENNNFVDAKQALCTMLIKKGEKTSRISVTKDFATEPERSIRVNLNDVINEKSQNPIIALNETEYKTLKRLKECPTVKDLPFITNSRGELDLTINKKQITQKTTEYKLARGRDIRFYEFYESTSSDYVDSSFVQKSAKKKYIEEE
ncbi:MAG: Eco57I restriction-modification methylase domain-containing protein, partial [Phoenicibacter congonensis]|nr:Eco57I restriction-modification methylase domain-containing protein [Phoenicibacter congonensis]